MLTKELEVDFHELWSGLLATHNLLFMFNYEFYLPPDYTGPLIKLSK